MEPRECNPKQNPSHCLQNNLHPSHRKKKKCKRLANRMKYSTSFFFFNQRNPKTTKKSACIPFSVDHNVLSCLRGRGPPLTPAHSTLGSGNREQLPQPFKESNLVIGLKGPTAPFPAISPKVKKKKKIRSNLKLRQQV